MSVATFAPRRTKLIRKALDATVIAAPEDGEAIEAITTGATRQLITPPTGWGPLGHHTEEEGLNWTRETENSDVRSHGSSEPTRRDIVSDVTGLTMIAQETNMRTLSMFHNIDESAITQDETTSEISLNRSSTPQTRFYRLLALAQDGAGDQLVYFARFLPRVSITEYAEQSWTKGQELRYSLTFTAYVDDELGYSMREMWGGPGIVELSEQMGLPAPTP
ncbi:hypothetical protein [Saccharopolyspora sp. 6V]|uniref:phage tail tube protein n=1 Tax=Saccharopolyspora sp. 6V TaxID=2877239 RepID=UPI001CD76BB8|nr:hypothetical protein [Saccharopolyspora sp. 6V]MCA1191616.1 hypothetical protein [Saccharopolyspora sp. 6V]